MATVRVITTPPKYPKIERVILDMSEEEAVELANTLGDSDKCCDIFRAIREFDR